MQTYYKKATNEFETNGDITLMTVLKKNGTPLITKIDTVDLEKVMSCGTWFAEWHKDYNSYLVQNISSDKLNSKGKPLKQSLQSVILDTLESTAISKHINGDTLDNTRSNLTIFDKNKKNEIEIIDNNTVAIILKDKYGNVDSKALISPEDLSLAITYTWVNHKIAGIPYVVSNTKEGRIFLDKFLFNTVQDQTIRHINLNPLDNRRNNIELKTI